MLGGEKHRYKMGEDQNTGTKLLPKYWLVCW